MGSFLSRMFRRCTTNPPDEEGLNAILEVENEPEVKKPQFRIKVLCGWAAITAGALLMAIGLTITQMHRPSVISPQYSPHDILPMCLFSPNATAFQISDELFRDGAKAKFTFPSTANPLHLASQSVTWLVAGHNESRRLLCSANVLNAFHLLLAEDCVPSDLNSSGMAIVSDIPEAVAANVSALLNYQRNVSKILPLSDHRSSNSRNGLVIIRLATPLNLIAGNYSLNQACVPSSASWSNQSHCQILWKRGMSQLISSPIRITKCNSTEESHLLCGTPEAANYADAHVASLMCSTVLKDTTGWGLHAIFVKAQQNRWVFTPIHKHLQSILKTMKQ